MQSKLLLIDGHSILNRAYYGLPDLTNSKGLHTNAVLGFLNMMFKFIDTEKPTHFAVAFDVSAPTFRHEMYEAYKGTRKPMDPELKAQVPMIQEMLTAMNIPIVKQAGLEADDILGTLAKRAEKAGAEVTIVSGDRDLLQLASDHIKISIPKTKKTGTEIENYYASDVLEQKQVTPEEFIDVKALMGDTSDNIPGVPSIGEKTATNLIVEYHTVENAYAHIDEVKPPRAQKNLREFYDQAILSKKLATINIDAPVSVSVDDAVLTDFYTEEAYKLCKEWEFKKLLVNFEQKDTPAEDFLSHFHTIADLSEWSEQAMKLGDEIGFSMLEVEENIYGLAVSDGEDTYFVRNEMGAFLNETFLDAAKKLVESGKKLSIRDVKPYLKKLPIEDAKQVFDAAIASYLIYPLSSDYPADFIAKDHLNLMIPSFTDLFGKLKGDKAYLADEEKTRQFICFDAMVSARVKKPLLEELKSQGMEKLYHEVELPLVFTLSDMEKEGMAMDNEALQKFGGELAVEIEKLETKIYQEAGEEFNINSPKQLGTILFEKLGLPNGKKTKTGYSTAADVLDKLAVEYPIVKDILYYRQLTKLKSTYVDGLGECLQADGRVHSTFQQMVTATGRISSTDPNLQNIPIRMELGKMIRKVFHPKEGYVFVDADYSQIELRVLAHLSQDPNLLQAYREGQDIHRSTASLVFHTPFDEVTDLQRSNAKAVNFGIVYGISAFGLSQDLNISRKEAQEYIDNYFAAYPVLHEYIERLVKDAKDCGYALTLFGRRRPIPELASSNFMQRQFGERVAMNSPIQGTAADIIKIAMVRVHDRLKREGLSSKLILQVHDELLIEAKESELEMVRTIMEEEMLHAADLSITLEIDMHEGKNWYDAK